MPAEVESLMYAREVPWHGFGTKVEGLQTAEEAIIAAGLDWKVIQKPLYYHVNNGKGRVKTVKVPDRVINVRATDFAPFGVVSPGYKVVQNVTSFDFADAIVESGEGKYETAGSLRGGRVVFLSMEIPRTVKVPGDDGEHKPYLLVANSHDGSRALSARVTTIRVVCMNTLNMALGNRNNEIKLRHTANVLEKVKEAQRALGLTFEYLEKFEAIAEKMMLRKLTDEEIRWALLETFPTKDADPKAHGFGPGVLKNLNDKQFRHVLEEQPSAPLAKAFRMYEESPNLDNIRGTAWGLFNGAAEYLDYGQFYRSRGVPAADNRATSILLGGQAAQKKELIGNLLASLSN